MAEEVKKKQRKSLDQVISSLNKKTGSDLLTYGVKTYEYKKIPFSSPRANYMTFGGLPRNKLVEFSGEESGGKTTTALDVCGQAQKILRQEWETEVAELESKKKLTQTETARLSDLKKLGPKKVCYVDVEFTFDPTWAMTNGVNVEELLICQPEDQTAEEIFEYILELLDTAWVGMLVLDSIGSLISQDEYDKEQTDAAVMGGVAKPLTRFGRRVAQLCKRNECLFIAINQLRDKMRGYGGTGTVGGRGWRHYCAIRIQFSKGTLINEKNKEVGVNSDSAYGNQVEMFLIKSKVFKPTRRKGFYTISYYDGVDYIADVFDMAEHYGIVKRSGGWFSFLDIFTGEVYTDAEGKEFKLQGRPAVIAKLKQDNEFLAMIYGLVEKADTEAPQPSDEEDEDDEE